MLCTYSFCLCISVQTVESDKLLKPILSPEEAPGKSSTTRTFVFFFSLVFCIALFLMFVCFAVMAVCVHGTYKKNLESILASGLKRMNRLHVHFSCGLPTDGEVISGKLLLMPFLNNCICTFIWGLMTI